MGPADNLDPSPGETADAARGYHERDLDRCWCRIPRGVLIAGSDDRIGPEGSYDPPPGQLFRRAPRTWVPSSVYPEFHQDYTCARHIRADIAFGEQIIDIADDEQNDWVESESGRLVPNKELVLRSKLRIEARQWQMARLQPQQWGDRQQIDNQRRLGAPDARRAPPQG